MTRHISWLAAPESITLHTYWLVLIATAAVFAFGHGARAQPTGACCNGTVCTLRTFATCTGNGGVFLGGSCTTNRCANTLVPCCGGGDCAVVSAAQCSSLGGEVLAASCEPNPCPGVCCTAGTCTFVIQAECSSSLRRGVACSPFNPCLASCCVNGSCTLTTHTVCNGSGGTWGEAGMCSPNPCLAPCCPGGGSCQIARGSNCMGTFAPAGAVACSPNPCPLPQCDLDVFENFGGLTTAVAAVSGDALLVARGSTLELFDLTNPSVPAAFNPPRRMALPAPAMKISSSPGSSRAFVELEDRTVFYVTIASPVPHIIQPDDIFQFNTVDILAEGDRVFIALYDDHTQNNRVEIHDVGADGLPDQVGSITPFLNNFVLDHIAKIGNTLWLGMHERNSNVFGIEGWDVSNPAAPVRRASSLNFAPLGSTTELSAMQAVGNKLLLSYDITQTGPVFIHEDWMRAADVTNPASPVWHPAVDLNGFAACMSSVAGAANHLRVAVKSLGVQTWDTSNPASLALLGTYSDASLSVRQMVAGVTNDYLAAARDGLVTLGFSNPASPQFRSQIAKLPALAQNVRQVGNTTAVVDSIFSQLRLMDYTLSESQQLRGSIALNGAPGNMELTLINTGSTLLACVEVGSGAQISIIDITNPAAPSLRTTFPVLTHLISATGTRLYVLTNGAEFRVYDISNPVSPNLLSTKPFGGSSLDYSCMTSWESGGVKAVALGTENFGLWLIDATQGNQPQVVDVHNPVSGLSVHSLARGSQFLYVGWTDHAFESRLESLNTNNLANPVVAYATGPGEGSGEPGDFHGLRFVSGPTGKFLVGTRAELGILSTDTDLIVFDINSPLGEAALHRIYGFNLPYAGSSIATSANGSSVLVSADTAGLYRIVMPQSWAPGFSAPAPGTTESVCLGGSAAFSVSASGGPVGSEITYQWFRSGSPSVALTNGPTPWNTVIGGATSPTLTISQVHPQDGPGFYFCQATNSCGTRNSAFVFLDLCPGDFNCSGVITVQDIFDFLAAFFAGQPLADVNGVSGHSVQDIFDFLAAYFAGCT